MTDPTSTPPSGDEPLHRDRRRRQGRRTDAAKDAARRRRPRPRRAIIDDDPLTRFDDLAEKATPAVREASARAAELTSAAATKAVPLARKAGEATADASGKLAVKSKAWASDLRRVDASRRRATPRAMPPTT